MARIKHLIHELSQFPANAHVHVNRDGIHVNSHPPHLVTEGFIHCPDSGKPRKTRLGPFEGWADANAEPAAVQLCRFLQTHPEAALDIATKALEGLYINQADGMTMLTGDNAYPRGSGSDFVEDIGQALETAGMMPLIERLQAEQEKREEES
jgi:hypothetical protein